jgi:DNA-binding MarR family transcriptional regulator
MSKLSSRLGVTPGTLTKTVAGLLRKNYLERQRSPDDDRVVRVSLSKEGRRAVSKIKEYRQGFFTKLCASLTQSECRRLVESHRFILETYRRILQERR